MVPSLRARALSARRAALGALLALLLAAPAASAADFRVQSARDDAGSCPGPACTLRAAVTAANATPEPDSVSFDSSIRRIGLVSTLTVTRPLVVDGGGHVELSPASGAADPVVRFAADADNSLLRSLIVTGANGVGVEVASGATNVTISRTPFFGAGFRPILLLGGANGGIEAPELAVGPRRADGGVVVRGRSPGRGVIEVFRGGAGSASPAVLLAAFEADGLFERPLGFEPAPGEAVSATLSIPGLGTSVFTIARAPADLAGPVIARARAVSVSEIALVPSEAVDPATLSPEDFELTMANRPAPVTSAQIAANGEIRLRASGWIEGEAGTLRLRGPGALADPAGNASGTGEVVRVAAAPGDVTGPVPASLSIRPGTICVTRSSRCRTPGARIRFVSPEKGEAALIILKGRRRLGARTYDVKVGRNEVLFDGRVRGRRLRAGTYNLHLVLEDRVGNTSPDPALGRFSVRRTRGR